MYSMCFAQKVEGERVPNYSTPVARNTSVCRILEKIHGKVGYGMYSMSSRITMCTKVRASFDHSTNREIMNIEAVLFSLYPVCHQELSLTTHLSLKKSKVQGLRPLPTEIYSYVNMSLAGTLETSMLRFLALTKTMRIC